MRFHVMLYCSRLEGSSVLCCTPGLKFSTMEEFEQTAVEESGIETRTLWAESTAFERTQIMRSVKGSATKKLKRTDKEDSSR